ncbi:MAG: sarcosine oxidase [Actinomycetota bacterium]|nr:sarcosine oxidase [Actinomycetota bacterium]
MDDSRFDVIVVGAGIMGSATAWALADAGRRVLLLERFTLGHDHGSSHGTSRIFRLSYPEAEYVAMAQEALPLWRSLESESGQRALITTGGFDFGKNMEEHATALEACGVEHEFVTGDEARTRWPWLRATGDGTVLYQPDAGIVLAAKAWTAFVERAVAKGASLRTEETVVAIEPGDNEMRVVTGDSMYTAASAVVTAGAWARDLLGPAGIDLDTVPTRETVAYFEHVTDRPMPSLVDWSEPAVYALATDDANTIKVGEHHAGPVTEPDAPGSLDEGSVARLQRWAAERLPGVRPRPLRAETCIYTNTPDERFVLERHDRIVVGSPCSGHGYKFAPLIGKRLAALALEVEA